MLSAVHVGPDASLSTGDDLFFRMQAIGFPS